MISYDLLIALIQYILLVVDIICNILDGYYASELYSRIIVYIFQNIAQVVLLILLCLLFFHQEILINRYIHQLFQKHSISLLVSAIYFILTLILQIAVMRAHWSQDNTITITLMGALT